MSYNGSGTFTINTSGQPVVAGTVITASAFNALTTDLATGLTTAITKDGQTTTTARIPFAQGINSSLVTDSSSTSTGSIITAGGVGVAKNIYVGGSISSAAATALTLQSAGTTAVTIDTSQNVGIGVTPSAWQSGTGAIQMPSNNSYSQYGVGKNAYYNGTSYIYSTSSYATLYQQNSSGQHLWLNAASGTAGNAVSFTQAMTLDASGNVGIGTSSPTHRLDLLKASGSGDVGTWALNGGATGYLYAGGSVVGVYDTASGGGNGVILGGTSVAVRFQGGGNEYGRFDSSGNLQVGTTNTASGGFQVSPDYNSTLSSAFVVGHASGSASGAVYGLFRYGANSIGSITQSGTTAVLYNVTSDQRLKENIIDAPEFGSVIDSIQVRSFDWKTDQTHQRAGFIAQELVTVAPEAVHQPTDTEEMMAVDYSKLVPMLVKEIQSLRTRFITLETKSDTQAETINALTARIVALESK